MSTKISEHCFEFGAVRYFRGNAHNVEIASYGEKKDPIGAEAQLDVQNRVSAEHLKSRVRFGTRAKIDWDQTTKASVNGSGSIKIFGIGGKSAGTFTYEKAKSAKLVLVSFAIAEDPLKKMLNQDAENARKFLAKEGKDARIVSEVWIVMEAELSEHFTTYGSKSMSVQADDKSLDITVTGGRYGSQTVSLSKGTTFAYKLHKVKDWNKEKTHIQNMEADEKGWQ